MTLTNPAVGDLITAAYGTEVAGWSQAWTAYTATLTASTTNPNIGTTGTAAGRYLQLGKTVFGYFKITWGGTGVTAGSGTYSIALPPPAALVGAPGVGGSFRAFHSPNACFPYPVLATSTTINLQYTATFLGTLTNFGQASPFAWGTAGDFIEGLVIYEAA